MKEFLFLFRGGDGREIQHSPEKWQAHMQKWMEWMNALAQKVAIWFAWLKTILQRLKLLKDAPYLNLKMVLWR